MGAEQAARSHSLAGGIWAQLRASGGLIPGPTFSTPCTLSSRLLTQPHFSWHPVGLDRVQGPWCSSKGPLIGHIRAETPILKNNLVSHLCRWAQTVLGSACSGTCVRMFPGFFGDRFYFQSVIDKGMHHLDFLQGRTVVPASECAGADTPITVRTSTSRLAQGR